MPTNPLKPPHENWADAERERLASNPWSDPSVLITRDDRSQPVIHGIAQPRRMSDVPRISDAEYEKLSAAARIAYAQSHSFR